MCPAWGGAKGLKQSHITHIIVAVSRPEVGEMGVE